MANHNRAKRGEFANRVPQAALDEISLMIQEQRELIDHLKTVNNALVEALTLALPPINVETALEDQGYKPGVVWIRALTKTIRAALKLANSQE